MKISHEFLRELFLHITAQRIDSGVDEETALILAARETIDHALTLTAQEELIPARVMQEMERNIMRELGLTVH